MMHTRIVGFVFGLLSVGLLAALAMRGADGPGQPIRQEKVMPQEGATLFIELGLKDSEATGWGGELQISEGKVISLRVLGGGGGAQPVEGTKWKGQSQVPAKKKTAVQPVRVRAILDGPPTAGVTVKTRHGEFSFKLADIPRDEGKLFLDDQARVTRGLLSFPLTDQPTDDDFPAAATAPDGTIWVAYVAYTRRSAQFC